MTQSSLKPFGEAAKLIFHWDVRDMDKDLLRWELNFEVRCCLDVVNRRTVLGRNMVYRFNSILEALLGLL